MTLSLLKTLKAGPPPPKVVLLPDAVFFTRAIPVPAGATAAAVAEQVELALETLSPFPPTQLYHGYYWPAGAERALVYAAYRRRFTSEQVSDWENAELILPNFAAMLSLEPKPNTTLVVPSAEGLAAVYWDDHLVPFKVEFRALPPDTTDGDRLRVQDELFGATPRNRQVMLAAPPTLAASSSDREFVFVSGDREARVPIADAGALDVRDKEALASLRRSRMRDRALWRTFLGFAAVLLLLGLGELALLGGDLWRERQLALANAQRPVVEKIAAAQNLTTRINELSTKRLLPFEMLDVVILARPQPNTIQFMQTTTSGLYGLEIRAQTASPPAVAAYQAALNASPAVERVEVRENRNRDNVATFIFLVTFKPEMLKPATSPTES